MRVYKMEVMAISNMSIFTKLFLIIVFVGDVKCLENSHLERRITSLESKVFFDSLEFRENIKSILEKFNVSINSDSKGTNDQTCPAKENLFEKDTKAIRRAVQSVKQNMNKEWQDYKTEMDQKIRPLQTDLNILKSEIKGQDLRFKALEEKFSSSITEMTQKVFLQTDMIINLTSEIKVQNLRLKAIEDKVSSSITELTQKVLLQTEMINNLITEINSQDVRLNAVNDELSSTSRKTATLILCSERNGQMFGSSCYYIPDDSKAWEDALSECNSSGAHLVSVESEAENEFLIGFARRLTSSKTDVGVWLGASDLEVEETWLWEWNKKNINAMYNNFKAPEPNGRNSENCLHLFRQSSWKWNDASCKSMMGYICEI